MATVNPFDRFDEPVETAGNPFDRFDAPDFGEPIERSASGDETEFVERPTRGRLRPAIATAGPSFVNPPAPNLPDRTKPEETFAGLGMKVIENAPTMFRQAGGGLLQALSEAEPTPPPGIEPGDPQWQEVVRAHRERLEKGGPDDLGRRIYEEATADLAANAPNVDPESLKGYAYDIAQGIVQMGPSIAASVATRSPAAGMTVLGGQVAGHRYGESRQPGRGEPGMGTDAGAVGGRAPRTPQQATFDAVFYGAAEAIPERVPLGLMMKPGGQFLSRLLKVGGAEGAQEMFTEALQMGYDAGALDETTPWGEVPGRLARAGIVGAGVGIGMAGVTQPFGRGEAPPSAVPPQGREEVPPVPPATPAPIVQPSAVEPAAPNPFDRFDAVEQVEQVEQPLEDILAERVPPPVPEDVSRETIPETPAVPVPSAVEPGVGRPGRPPSPAAVPRARGPMDVLQFIASVGGIRDEGGEMKAMDADRRFLPGFGKFVRPTGRDIDAIGEALHQEGYFGPPDATPRPTEREVLDLIDRNMRGERIYTERDMPLIEEREYRRRIADAKAEIRTALDEMGDIDLTPEMADEVRERVAAGEDAYDILGDIAERQAIEWYESEAANGPAATELPGIAARREGEASPPFGAAGGPVAGAPETGAQAGEGAGQSREAEAAEGPPEAVARSFDQSLRQTKFTSSPAARAADGRSYRIKREGDGYIAMRMPDQRGNPPTYMRPEYGAWTEDQAVAHVVDAIQPAAAPISQGSKAVMPSADTDASLARSRPRNQVTFSKPYVGKTGAKLVGYEWVWRKEEIIDRRGEDRVIRVSDWEQSITNPETNREIVHQFYIEPAEGGEERIVSAETAAKLLGIAQSTVRTSAKRLLEQEIARAKAEERVADDMAALENAETFATPAEAIEKGRQQDRATFRGPVWDRARASKAWGAEPDQIIRENKGRMHRYEFLRKDDRYIFGPNTEAAKRAGWQSVEFRANEIWDAQGRDRMARSGAEPAPLYANRPVTNAADIISWARAQGFKQTLTADDMHVTVAFSRDPVDWTAAGKTSPSVAVTGGERSIEQLGDEGAVVLRFASDELNARWQQYRDTGASWDFKGYKPHITITYDAGGLDLSKVEPYRGPIALGPEAQASLDTDATSKVKEVPTPPPTDATPEGEQRVVPGTERISDRALAERRMEGRKKPAAEQKPADEGLFDVQGRGQKDMFATRGTPARPVVSTSREQRGNIAVEFTVSDEFAGQRNAIAREIRDMLDGMGLKDVGLRMYDRIVATVGTETFEVGGRHVGGVIDLALSDTAEVARFARHEAIHAMREMRLFSKSEWSTLSAASKRMWREQYDIDRGYSFATEEQKTEEGIAHAYSDWRAGKLRISGLVKRAFEKMQRFLEAVGNVLRGRGFNTVDSIFGKIEGGKVGARPRGAGRAGEQGFYRKRADAEADVRKFERKLGYVHSVEEAYGGYVVSRNPAQTADRLLAMGMPREDMSEGLREYLAEREGPGEKAAPAGRREAERPSPMLEAAEPDQLSMFARKPRKATPEGNGMFGTNFSVASEAVWSHMQDRNRTLLSRVGATGKAASDVARQKLQDRMLVMRRVQEAVERARQGALPESENVYLAEELYYGRTGKQLDDFKDRTVEPLIEAINAEGLTLEQVDEYLYARHAPERNARIAEINPEIPEGGSGMTDAEAQVVMDRIASGNQKAGYERIAARIDNIIRKTNKIRLDGGLVDQDTLNVWGESYAHYVPLRGFAEIDIDNAEPARPRTGKGFDIRGEESRRAFGRTSRAADILANVITAHEEAIVRSEKNRVGQTFLRFAVENPNPALWELAAVEYKPRLNRETGLVEYGPDPRYTLKDNVLAVKVKGKVYHVTIHHKALARAMKNIGADTGNGLLRALQRTNRWLAFINTSANPEFVLSNFLRDIQTAGINLQGMDTDRLTRRVLRDVPRAVQGTFRGIRGDEKSEWGRYYQEYAKAGGKTAFFALDDVTAKQKRIQSLLKDIDPSNARRVWNFIAKDVEGLIQDVNAAVENGVRLSTYVNMRRSGFTEKQAASAAKNLTVNFNRKGEWAGTAQALYLFYNASIQGSVRLIHALRHKRVQKVVAGIVITHAMIDIVNGLMSPTDDDDEKKYDKITPYTKYHNLVIANPWAGNDPLDILSFKVPLPYGYNVFAVTGYKIGEVIRSAAGIGKKVDPLKAAVDLVSIAVEAFNPMGGEKSVIRTLIPTLLKPVYELETNRNFMDVPIMPDQPAYDVPKPDSERYFRNVSPASKWFAQELNRLTGGNKVRPGAVDISPETFDHWVKFMTGGTGAFVQRSSDTFYRAVSGDHKDIRWNEIPFARRLVEGNSQYYTRQRYYEIRDAAQMAEKEAKTYATDAGEQKRIRKDYRAEIAIGSQIDRTDKTLRRLRRQRNVIEANEVMDDDVKKARLDAIEERMDRLMTGVIRLYNRMARPAEPAEPPAAE